MPGSPEHREKAGANAPAFSDSPYDRGDPPIFSLSLRPYRSLSVAGFRKVLIFTAAGLTIPLLPFLGTPVAWGLLPFLVGALLALYAAIMRSYRDGTLHEELRLWSDLITVERFEPRGAVQRWHANPYWVTPHLYPNKGPVENYLTLKGNGREIELGSFLSPEEREGLLERITQALREVRTA